MYWLVKTGLDISMVNVIWSLATVRRRWFYPLKMLIVLIVSVIVRVHHWFSFTINFKNTFNFCQSVTGFKFASASGFFPLKFRGTVFYHSKNGEINGFVPSVNYKIDSLYIL